VILLGLILFLHLTNIMPVGGAAVKVAIAPDQVTVHMNLVFQENATSLPLVSIYLDSSNSTAVIAQIAPAIQKLVQGANIASLTLRAQTLNSSQVWYLRENYTLVLSGTNKNLGSTVRSDLAFVSMDAPDSIKSGGLELNTVGLAFLVKPLNSQGNQTLFYVNGHQSLNSVIPVQTALLFHLLDFSWVPSVSFWANHRDLLGQVTTMSFDSGGPRFNLTFGPRSPENTLLKAFTAVYYPSLEISVPASAWVEGTVVSFDLSTKAESWMPLTAGASLVTLAAVGVLDRSLTKVQRARKKKASK